MFFDALIVDPNPMSRGYLWQATLAEPNFRRVKAVAGLPEALTQLIAGHRYDVLLITSTVEPTEISQFVPQARQTAAGKEAAYVIVLKQKDQESENIATGLVGGTDGFLLEPFSVHSLRQVAAIAARVRGEHERERARAAISIMLTELIPTLDAYAEAKRKKVDGSNEKKNFQKSASGLKKIVQEQKELYVELATAMFEQAQPRQKKSGYKGASQRVREKFKPE